jgi:L-ectoine synthase
VLVRTIDEVTTVPWGNGLSRRFLLAGDGLGYTLTDTLVHAGTRSLLQYTNHLEACYCIEGAGRVTDTSGNAHRLKPGTLYALDQHDAHVLEADPGQDMRLVCVFSPALVGDERHQLDGDGHSSYGSPSADARLVAVPATPPDAERWAA